MSSKPLRTAEAVFEALGGVRAVAELTNSTYAAAWNWRKLGSFPPRFYTVMAAALTEKGFGASETLWRMSEGNGHGAASSAA